MTKKMTIIVLVFGLFFSSVQADEKSEQLTIMDAAVEQATLVPAVIKTSIAVFMNLRYGNLAVERKDTMKRYRQINKMFKIYNFTPEEQRIQDRGVVLWEMIQEIVAKKQTLETIQALRKNLPILFANRIALAKQAQTHTGIKSSVQLLAFGKLKALSQRFAATYMYLKNAKGDKQAMMMKMIQEDIKQFKGALAKVDHKGNDTVLLGNLKKNLLFFEYKIQNRNQFTPSIIIKKTSRMSKDAKSLAQAYMISMRSPSLK